jgi:hypothetical protein
MAKNKETGGEPLTDKITVQGPERGRWRCGFKFGVEPLEVEVTQEQFEVITSDPHLKLVLPTT